jgi:hypothetical protein
LLLLLLFPAVPSTAATLSGFVRDHGNGESLPFANVVLKGENRGTTTNEKGYYAIPDLAPGRHTLVVSLVGYRIFQKEIQLAEKNLVVDVRLTEEAIQMAGTTVEAERQEVETHDISPGRTLLQVRDLKAAPAAIEADPMRTIQTLPGVASLSDFSVGLYVRGGTPDQNLVLLDGTDVYNASHLFGLFSTFPADAAKSTELLRGGFPAKYGDRLSAVLNVLTDEGNKERFEAQGGVGLLSSRLTVQGPALKGSYLLSGRRTHLEPVLALARKALDAKKFGYNFYDLQGKTHQVLSHDDQLSVAAYAGQDGLLYRFDEFNFDLTWGNRAASVQWTHVLDSELFSSFLLTGSRFRSSTVFDSEDARFYEKNHLDDVSFKADVSYFPSARHSFEAGVQTKQLSMDYRFGEAAQEYVHVDMDGFLHAAYLQDSWAVDHRLSLLPGLRFSYLSNGGYHGWGPRLAARYQLGSNTCLKGAAGLYHQYLFSLAREFQGISLMSNIWTVADSTAAPSEARHYIAGAETRWAGLDLDAEAYFKEYEGLYEINYENQESTALGDILRRGDGQAYGVDLLIKKRAGRHTGWLSFSTALSERTIAGLNLGEDGWEQPFRSKFDRRFTVDLVYSYHFRRQWTFNAAFSGASGQPYTQVLGRGEIEEPSGFRWTFDEKGPLNGVRLPGYRRLDLALERQFTLGNWGGMKLYVQVVNVTNHKNVFNYFWSEGDAARRKPGKRKEIPMLPILPSFGVDFNL